MMRDWRTSVKRRSRCLNKSNNSFQESPQNDQGNGSTTPMEDTTSSPTSSTRWELFLFDGTGFRSCTPQNWVNPYITKFRQIMKIVGGFASCSLQNKARIASVSEDLDGCFRSHLMKNEWRDVDFRTEFWKERNLWWILWSGRKRTIYEPFKTTT